MSRRRACHRASSAVGDEDAQADGDHGQGQSARQQREASLQLETQQATQRIHHEERDPELVSAKRKHLVLEPSL